MPEPEVDSELQELYAEARRRGMFKSDPELSVLVQEAVKRGMLKDLSGGSVYPDSTPATSAPAPKKPGVTFRDAGPRHVSTAPIPSAGKTQMDYIGEALKAGVSGGTPKPAPAPAKSPAPSEATKLRTAPKPAAKTKGNGLPPGTSFAWQKPAAPEPKKAITGARDVRGERDAADARRVADGMKRGDTPQSLRAQEENLPGFSRKNALGNIADTADFLFAPAGAVMNRITGDMPAAKADVKRMLAPQGATAAASRAFAQGMAPGAGGLQGFAAGSRIGAQIPGPPIVKGIAGLAGGMLGAAGGGALVQAAQDKALEALLGSENFADVQAQMARDAQENPLATSLGGAATNILYARPTLDDVKAIPAIINMVRSGTPLRAALQSEAGRMLSDTLRERVMEGGIEVLAAAGQSLVTGKPMSAQDTAIQAISGALMPGENRLGSRLVGVGRGAVDAVGGALASRRGLPLDFSGGMPDMQASAQSMQAAAQAQGMPPAPSLAPPVARVAPSVAQSPVTLPVSPIPQASPYLMRGQNVDAPPAPTRGPILLPEAPPAPVDVVRQRLMGNQGSVLNLLRQGVGQASDTAPVAPPASVQAPAPYVPSRTAKPQSVPATMPERAPLPTQEQYLKDAESRIEQRERPGSWIVTDNATGEPVTELFDARLVAKLNTEKYTAVPANEYAAALNGVTETPEEKSARRKAQLDNALLRGGFAPTPQSTPPPPAPRPAIQTPQYDSLAAMQSASPSFSLPEYVPPSGRGAKSATQAVPALTLKAADSGKPISIAQKHIDDFVTDIRRGISLVNMGGATTSGNIPQEDYISRLRDVYESNIKSGEEQLKAPKGAYDAEELRNIRAGLASYRAKNRLLDAFVNGNYVEGVGGDFASYIASKSGDINDIQAIRKILASNKPTQAPAPPRPSATPGKGFASRVVEDAPEAPQLPDVPDNYRKLQGASKPGEYPDTYAPEVVNAFNEWVNRPEYKDGDMSGASLTEAQRREKSEALKKLPVGTRVVAFEFSKPDRFGDMDIVPVTGTLDRRIEESGKGSPHQKTRFVVAVRKDSGGMETYRSDFIVPLESPRVEAPAAPQIKPLGKTSTVSTPDNETIPVQWHVAEASSLRASHVPDALGNLTPNPNYDSTLQPRDRSRVASREQVEDIAGKLSFNRVAESPTTADGAPIIGDDNQVESGNGRTISIQKAYSEGKPSAEKYRADLIANAEKFGIAPATVEGMKEPVLVRVRLGKLAPEARAALAERMGKSTVAEMSETEKALSDSQRLLNDDRVLNQLASSDIRARSNEEFTRAFAGMLDVGDRAGLYTPKGELSQAGEKRIERAIIAAAYEDAGVLESLYESPVDGIKAVANALRDAAPEVARMKRDIKRGYLPALDFSEDLVAAVREFTRIAKGSDLSASAAVKAYLANTAMDFDMGPGLSPIAEDTLAYLGENANRGAKLGHFIKSYVSAVRAVGDPANRKAFDVGERPTRGDILEAAKRRAEERYAKETTSSLFDSPVQKTGGATKTSQAVEKPGKAQPANRSQDTAPDEVVPKAEAAPTNPQPAPKAAQAESPAPVAQEVAKPAESEPVTLASHAQFFRDVRANGITPEALLAQHDRTVASKAAIVAELNKKTVAELGRFVYARPGEKKADLVEKIYQGVLNSYTLDKTVSWQPFSETYEQASERVLKSITQEDIDSYIEKRKDALKAKEKEQADTQQAIENPQTYEDYRTLIRAKGGIDNLTPEQKRTYEDLLAEKTKADRKAQAPTRAAVPAPSGAAYSVVEHFHSKRGANVYIAVPAERMDTAQYQSELSRAKALGGYYSRAWQDSPGGFAFKSKTDADTFSGNAPEAPTEAQDGQEDAAPTNAPRNPAAERMRATAERMEESANESLNRDRKVNTAKRAGQAASAEADANRTLRIAKTMRAIADAIESGTAKYLDGVKSRAVIEDLDSLLKAAKWAAVRANGERTDTFDDRPTKIEDIDSAEYPYPGLRRSDLKSAISELSQKRVGRAKIAGLEANAMGGEPPQPKKIGALTVTGVEPYSFTYEDREKIGYDKKIPEAIYIYAVKAGGTIQGAAPGQIVYTAQREPSFGQLRMYTTPQSAALSAVSSMSLNAIGDNYAGFYTPYDPNKWVTIKSVEDIEMLRSVNALSEFYVDRFKRLQNADIKTPAELKAALREYLSLASPAPASDPIKKAERELVGKKIPGYFPTPPALVEKMLGYADIQPGMSVLEPSAGKGNIADAIREAAPDATISAIEPVSALRTILEAKGHELVGHDFLEHEGEYDRIVMNPPFEDGQDMAHVRHAYDLLKPGGKLVAITSEGPFFRNDKKAQEFRQWLEETGGESEKNPDKSFMDSERSTGVATRMVTIEKPASAPTYAERRESLKAAQAEELDNLKAAVRKEAGKLYSNPVPSPEILRAGGKWLAYEVAIRGLDAQQAFANSAEALRAMADEFGDWVTLHKDALLESARDYWTSEVVPDFKATKNAVPVWIEGDEALSGGEPVKESADSFTRQTEPVKKTAESLPVAQGDLGGESPLSVSEQEFLKKPRNQDEDEARQTESAALEALKAPDADKRGVSKTYAYRGVSQDELEAIVKNQEIKSDGRANFESESGTTSFTDNPITANNYATTFRTQTSKRENPDGAFYILRVKQDGSMVRDAEDGYLKTPNAIPFSSVDKIIEVRPKTTIQDVEWASDLYYQDVTHLKGSSKLFLKGSPHEVVKARAAEPEVHHSQTQERDESGKFVAQEPEAVQTAQEAPAAQSATPEPIAAVEAPQKPIEPPAPPASAAPSEPANPNARKLLKIATQQEIAQELGAEDWTERGELKQAWAQVIQSAEDNYDTLAPIVLELAEAPRPSYLPRDQIVIAKDFQIKARREVRRLTDEGKAGTPEFVAAVAHSAKFGKMIAYSRSESARDFGFGRALFDGESGEFIGAAERANEIAEGKLSQASQQSIFELARRGEKAQEALTDRLESRAEAATEQAQEQVRQVKRFKRTAADTKKPDYGATNTLFTKEKYEAALAKLKKENNPTRRGAALPSVAFSAEEIQAIRDIGGFHFEAGIRRFADWAAQVSSDAGRDIPSATLGRVWNEIVPRYRRFMTADEYKAAMKSRIEAMQATGKPSKAGTPRQSNPLLDVATAEYAQTIKDAKGAKSLDAWAKGVEKRLGETLPDNVREDLFREAARRFAVDNQPVERIRREMAQKIESEVLKTRPAHIRAFKTLEAYRSAMRSIVTSVDLSGLGNQGGILAIARPALATGGKGHAGAIRHMIEAAKSEENIAMLTADITTNQEVKYGDKEFYKKVGLELSDTGAGADLTSKEENYLSNMAAKLPLVAGSERAYSAVLNSLRSATFDALYEAGMSQDEARDLARYINVATGRGDLSHSVKMATPMLANIFFSPRYAISRVQYLTAQPIFAASTSRTRRLIAKEYARYLSKLAIAVTLGVAGGLVKKELPEFDKDGRPIPPLLRPLYAMTASDAGVFKVPVPGTAGGQVYLDFYSSNKQWVTFAATILARQKAMQDGGMREAKLTETGGRFLRSKLAPDLGLAVNIGEGTDFIGNPTTAEGTLRGLLPMSLSEVIKGFAELGTQPAEANRLMVSLGLIGAAAVSATGFKATYRNKAQEQDERAKAKGAATNDPMYRILDQSSPLRNLPGIPKPPPPPPFVPRQRI